MVVIEPLNTQELPVYPKKSIMREHILRQVRVSFSGCNSIILGRYYCYRFHGSKNPSFSIFVRSHAVLLVSLVPKVVTGEPQQPHSASKSCFDRFANGQHHLPCFIATRRLFSTHYISSTWTGLRRKGVTVHCQ